MELKKTVEVAAEWPEAHRSETLYPFVSITPVPSLAPRTKGFPLGFTDYNQHFMSSDDHKAFLSAIITK
jgi:hypothetical protein